MKSASTNLTEELRLRTGDLAPDAGVSRTEIFPAAALLPVDLPVYQSALDLAGPVVGCVEGPSDQSTNPLHMRAFGR